MLSRSLLAMQLALMSSGGQGGAALLAWSRRSAPSAKAASVCQPWPPPGSPTGKQAGAAAEVAETHGPLTGGREPWRPPLSLSDGRGHGRCWPPRTPEPPLSNAGARPGVVGPRCPCNRGRAPSHCVPCGLCSVRRRRVPGVPAESRWDQKCPKTSLVWKLCRSFALRGAMACSAPGRTPPSRPGPCGSLRVCLPGDFQ